MDSTSRTLHRGVFAQKLHGLPFSPCMCHTGAAYFEWKDAAARRGRSPVEILARWQCIKGKGGGQAANGFSSPDWILDSLVSGEHCTPLYTPPQSALSQQKKAWLCTMRTWHICIHVSTVALQCQHTDNPEHSLHALLPAIMQPVMIAKVQPTSAISHDLPSLTLNNMSIMVPLPVVRHRKGCSCLFSKCYK